MQRATVALKSSFFVPKRRKTYGCEMPAAFAIASVDAPWRPRAANSACAASSTVSRRSSALRLVVVAMSAMLVTSHYLVKRRRNALDVVRAEAGVERQRQRTLVAAIRARERPLVAVGPEPVERVGADLRLDPLPAQRLERLVAPVELHHVGLPAVPVALLRTRELDEPVESPGVGGGEPLPRPQEVLERAELREPDRAEDVGEAEVEVE